MDFQSDFTNKTLLENSTVYLEPSTCYSGEDASVCVRIGILSLLILITAFTLVGRVIQIYVYRGRNPGQFVVLFLGLFMLLILTIHVTYAPNVQLDFTAILVVVMQFLIIWIMHLSWASRLVRRENAFYYLVCPALTLLLVGYLGVYVWALVEVRNGLHDCSSPQWLVFSVCLLVLVQLFVVTVVIIVKKVDQISTLRIDRYSQMAQLLFIAIMFEFISLFSFVYDMYLFFVKENCKIAFSANENVTIFIESLNTIVKYLIPQLAIVIVFAPLDRRQFDSPEIGTKTSLRHTYPIVSVPTERDPLLAQPINQPELKPSPPENHYPSLPRSSPYVPTSGFNYYYSNPYRVSDTARIA